MGVCARVARVAAMATGPVFAAEVAGVDPAGLNGYALVDLVGASCRLVSWAQAIMLGAVAELAHCPTGAEGEPRVWQEGIDPHARDEVAAALGCTPRWADGLISQAFHMVEEVPVLHAALAAGRVDLWRAQILADETLGVADPETRRVIVERVLDGVEHLTPGQLRTRVRRAVLAVDPRGARGRERRAVAGRRVVGFLDPRGAATLAGYGLPVGRAMAAEARISAIARVTRKAGDSRTLDALRADTMLALLLGEGIPPADSTADSMAEGTPDPAGPAAATPKAGSRASDTPALVRPRAGRPAPTTPETVAPETGGPESVVVGAGGRSDRDGVGQADPDW